MYSFGKEGVWVTKQKVVWVPLQFCAELSALDWGGEAIIGVTGFLWDRFWW